MTCKDSQYLALLLSLLAACSSSSSAPTDAGPADGSPADVQQADTNLRDAGPTDTGPGDTGAADTSPVDAPADTTTDSGDASSTYFSSYPGDVWEGETHVAVGTNGYVAAVWIASSDPTWGNGALGATSYIGYRFSTDSGSTWTPVQGVAVPPPLLSTDPSVAVDTANNFYVAFEAVALGPVGVTSQHVFVAKAPAGTTTFGAPSEVTDPAESQSTDAGVALYYYDKPWIAVTKDQEVVVSYSRRDWKNCTSSSSNWEACVSNIMVGWSADAQSWSRVQVTSNTASSGPDGGLPDGVNTAFTCVSASTSRLWVVYDEFGPATHGLGTILQYSDDDGATWSAATVIAPPTDTDVSFNDPSCAGDGSDVWVAYEMHTSNETLASAIQIVHSADGGQTFGAPVNSLDTSASSLAWHATVVREPNGHLDVEYYGGAYDGDTLGSLFYVHSADQGMSWTKATAIKHPITLVNWEVLGWTDAWLGDYLGVTTSGGSLYTTFTDNSSGTAHVDFAKVTLP